MKLEYPRSSKQLSFTIDGSAYFDSRRTLRLPAFIPNEKLTYVEFNKEDINILRAIVASFNEREIKNSYLNNSTRLTEPVNIRLFYSTNNNEYLLATIGKINHITIITKFQALTIAEKYGLKITETENLPEL